MFIIVVAEVTINRDLLIFGEGLWFYNTTIFSLDKPIHLSAMFQNQEKKINKLTSTS